MAYTTQDAVESIRWSRKHFHKHIAGLKDEQWTWKPYPECKSVIETLAHLVTDDRAALEGLKTGQEPDYDSLSVAETDRERLLKMLGESHEALCGYILEKWGNSPVDTEVGIFGSPMKLGAGVGLLSSEDFYHAGQIAFIRGATDPSWDYYTDVFGGG